MKPELIINRFSSSTNHPLKKIMKTAQPLTHLHVIGVPYRNADHTAPIVEVLNAFDASGAYGKAGVPFVYSEVHIAEADKVDVETDNIGRLNGEIADQVAKARSQNQAILLTGGNCCHITGVVGGLQDVHGPDVKVGLVWFDAHGDYNTPHTSLSGMLGGMPVAVCAGLAFPKWRELSHIKSPIPTDRIVMVDVRNLDEAEEALVRATGVVTAAPAAGFPGVPLEPAIQNLAENCDIIYLHIDSDILDERYVPNHGTVEPNGPSMDEVMAALDVVMETGKVAVLALVSVYGEGEGADISIASGIEVLERGLASWNAEGLPTS
ncbi:MAG: arginase [Candidatus Promineifilaceae bacterium]